MLPDLKPKEKALVLVTCILAGCRGELKLGFSVAQAQETWGVLCSSVLFCILV